MRTKLDAHIEHLKYADSTKEERAWVNNYIDMVGKLNTNLAKLTLDRYDRERKAYCDRLIKERAFEVGDQVLFYRGIIPQRGLKNNLCSPWHGPKRIVRIFNAGMNYILENRITTNIHKEHAAKRPVVGSC